MKKFAGLRVSIAILVVILGLSAIAWFTWHLGKLFVGLVAESPVTTQDEKEETKSEILSLPEVKIWTCQAGVFKDKRNAENMVASLREKGWKAEIIKDEPYTIGIGLFSSKEEAALQGAILAENGLNVWVREESFPALHYRVSGKNADKITLTLSLANSMLGGLERDQAKEELAGDMEFLFTGGYPSYFEKLNNSLFLLLSSNYQVEGAAAIYHQDLLELFIEYKLIATKYLKNYK